jgi:2-polyprenyl-3-methyl-5-hydroxy-6-metoxy-1,4-benzoquinol methylase
MWLERGVFSRLALRGGRVLELACGDGFNARNFYSGLSKEVIACDFDEKAIRVAKRKNHAENIKFVMSDIRENMPEGQFQNVIWDAAIEHFTRDEIDLIIGNLKKRLEATGILSGYTIIEREDKRKSLSHHEYEFKSKEDLYDLLRQYFKKVKVFSTCSPDRNNLYFWASDEGILPFDSESDCAIQSSVKMP